MNNTDTQIQVPNVKINGTTISKVTPGGVNLGTGTVNGFNGNEILIHKVIGYRISI